MTVRAPRILIADDHPLFRVGLGYALRGLGFEIVAEAGDGTEAVDRCLATRPDAALLDAKMPTLDGVSACARIAAARPDIRLVLLTTFAEPALVQAAREAGAAGFVSKETEPEALAGILRRLIADPSARAFPAVDLPSLTPRELEVLRFLAQGLTNKEIARQLGLSPETVKDRVLNVYRKLDADDRIGAARRARELGLV